MEEEKTTRARAIAVEIMNGPGETCETRDAFIQGTTDIVARELLLAFEAGCMAERSRITSLLHGTYSREESAAISRIINGIAEDADG